LLEKAGEKFLGECERGEWRKEGFYRGIFYRPGETNAGINGYQMKSGLPCPVPCRGSIATTPFNNRLKAMYFEADHGIS